jgi:uncharacterized delta-60 repeat protein
MEDVIAMIIEKRIEIAAVVLFSIFLVTASTVNVEAAAGDLDLTFGAGGKVVSDLGYDDNTRAIGIQPDGRIVVATKSRLAIFSAEGALEQVFGHTEDTYEALVVQPDGKIVTVGDYVSDRYDCQSRQIRVRRFNSDGTADASFGVYTGLTIYSPGCDRGAYARAVALQGGKVVVAGMVTVGQTGQYTLALRLNSNGTFDTSFNQDGSGQYLEGSWASEAHSLAIHARSGRIVLGGFAYTNNFTSSALIMLKSNGHPDWSFGESGAVYTDWWNYNQLDSVEFQSDGKIVAGGIEGGTYTTVSRYNSDGSLDPSFGSWGIGLVDVGYYETIVTVAMQEEGRMIGQNRRILAASSRFAIYRLNNDGILDPTFNGDGIVESVFEGVADCRSMAVQPDGKIVLAGTTAGDIALARYMP